MKIQINLNEWGRYVIGDGESFDNVKLTDSHNEFFVRAKIVGNKVTTWFVPNPHVLNNNGWVDTSYIDYPYVDMYEADLNEIKEHITNNKEFGIYNLKDAVLSNMLFFYVGLYDFKAKVTHHDKNTHPFFRTILNSKKDLQI